MVTVIMRAMITKSTIFLIDIIPPFENYTTTEQQAAETRYASQIVKMLNNI